MLGNRFSGFGTYHSNPFEECECLRVLQLDFGLRLSEILQNLFYSLQNEALSDSGKDSSKKEADRRITCQGLGDLPARVSARAQRNTGPRTKVYASDQNGE
jgi:hypothetical protein